MVSQEVYSGIRARYSRIKTEPRPSSEAKFHLLELKIEFVCNSVQASTLSAHSVRLPLGNGHLSPYIYEPADTMSPHTKLQKVMYVPDVAAS